MEPRGSGRDGSAPGGGRVETALARAASAFWAAAIAPVARIEAAFAVADVGAAAGAGLGPVARGAAGVAEVERARRSADVGGICIAGLWLPEEDRQ